MWCYFQLNSLLPDPNITFSLIIYHHNLTLAYFQLNCLSSKLDATLASFCHRTLMLLSAQHSYQNDFTCRLIFLTFSSPKYCLTVKYVFVGFAVSTVLRLSVWRMERLISVLSSCTFMFLQLSDLFWEPTVFLYCRYSRFSSSRQAAGFRKSLLPSSIEGKKVWNWI